MWPDLIWDFQPPGAWEHGALLAGHEVWDILLWAQLTWAWVLVDQVSSKKQHSAYRDGCVSAPLQSSDCSLAAWGPRSSLSVSVDWQVFYEPVYIKFFSGPAMFLLLFQDTAGTPAVLLQEAQDPYFFFRREKKIWSHYLPWNYFFLTHDQMCGTE